jgi:hypothetical protein
LELRTHSANLSVHLREQLVVDARFCFAPHLFRLGCRLVCVSLRLAAREKPSNYLAQSKGEGDLQQGLPIHRIPCHCAVVFMNSYTLDKLSKLAIDLDIEEAELVVRLHSDEVALLHQDNIAIAALTHILHNHNLLTLALADILHQDNLLALLVDVLNAHDLDVLDAVVAHVGERLEVRSLSHART